MLIAYSTTNKYFDSHFYLPIFDIMTLNILYKHTASFVYDLYVRHICLWSYGVEITIRQLKIIIK